MIVSGNAAQWVTSPAFHQPIYVLPIQLIGRDHSINQPPALRSGGIVLAAHEPDFPGAFLTDDTRQYAGAPTSVKRANARTILAEARVFGGDGDIAQYMQYVPAADGEAIDSSNYRFGDITDDPLQGENFKQSAFRLTVAARLGPLLLVPPGTKGAVTGTSEADNTNLGVSPRAFEAFDQLIHCLSAKCIQAFLTVDGNGGQTVIDFVTDILELHGVSSFIRLVDAALKARRSDGNSA